VYSSPNIVRGIKSRRMKWAVHISHMAYKTLVGKSEAKKSLGRLRHT
jgi:hypothetical protein